MAPAALQDKKNEARAKAIFNSVLQKKEQIQRAIQNLYDRGAENTVRCKDEFFKFLLLLLLLFFHWITDISFLLPLLLIDIELNVNLSAHTKEGLTEEEVLNVILEKQRELHEQNGKRINNILILF